MENLTPFEKFGNSLNEDSVPNTTGKTGTTKPSGESIAPNRVVDVPKGNPAALKKLVTDSIKAVKAGRKVQMSLTSDGYHVIFDQNATTRTQYNVNLLDTAEFLLILSETVGADLKK